MRRSVDKTINIERKLMIKGLIENRWMILNGSYEEEGGWICIGGAGTSVIDYVVTNVKAWEEIKTVEERNKTESDHIPLEVELEGIVKKMEIKKERIEMFGQKKESNNIIGTVKDGNARKKRYGKN